MHLSKRISIILPAGSLLIAFEILGFHLLHRAPKDLSLEVAPAFQSLANGVQSAKVFANLVKTLVPQAPSIPQRIWGSWVVSREIPTTTISCWRETESKNLLGTEIEYSGNLFRWKDVLTWSPIAETRIITAEQFSAENSGQGSHSSQVTFRQLGIKATQVTQIVIHHPPADITGGTVEIPGDVALVKNKDTIIFSACNTYFEAKCVPTRPSAR